MLIRQVQTRSGNGKCEQSSNQRERTPLVSQSSETPAHDAEAGQQHQI